MPGFKVAVQQLTKTAQPLQCIQQYVSAQRVTPSWVGRDRQERVACWTLQPRAISVWHMHGVWLTLRGWVGGVGWVVVVVSDRHAVNTVAL
jgi:hypothetical protein